MNVLTGGAAAEIVVKNSRFIAEAFPVSEQNSAREMIREQKNRYADARHVAHAFVIGAKREIMGMSDDGEPAGTAGRPILDVLCGADCTNILLTVTRYFGGILLGTGGLVRAYGGAAKAALEAARFEPLVEKAAFSLALPYELYDAAKRLVQAEGFHLSDVAEDFAESVRISGKIFAQEAEDFARRIFDLSKGRVAVEAG